MVMKTHLVIIIKANSLKKIYMSTIKNGVALIALFYVIGCNNINDPLQAVKLDRISEKELIKELLSNTLVTDNLANKDSIKNKGSINLLDFINRYTYMLEIDDKVHEIPLRFDNEKYTFGSVRSLHLNLSDLKEQELNDVISLYNKWYEKSEVSASGEIKWSSDNKIVNLLNNELDGKKYYYIKYFDIDFEKRNRRIKDSTEQNQTIDKLVRINDPNCRWADLSTTQKRFIYKISVSRREKFDYRKLKSIRFDLIVNDEFGEELFLEKNLTVALKTPLGPLKDPVGDRDPFYSQPLNDIEYSVEYNIFNPQFKSLERARKYSLNNTILSKGIITKVVMDDGTVISN